MMVLFWCDLGQLHRAAATPIGTPLASEYRRVALQLAQCMPAAVTAPSPFIVLRAALGFQLVVY